MGRVHTSVSVLMLIALSGLASASLAQAPAPKPAETLGGPKVVDQSVPDAPPPGFGNSADRRGMREIPMQAFGRALMEALGPDAPADVRATAEQTEKLRKMVADFTAAQQAFQREHRADLEKLRQLTGDGPRGRGDRAGDRRNPGDQPAPMMDEAERAQLTERARELREKAPQAGDVQKAMWAELNDAQKKAAQAKLDVIRKDMQERSNQQYLERRARQREGGQPQPGSPGAEQRRPGPEPRRPGAEPGRPGPEPRRPGPDAQGRPPMPPPPGGPEAGRPGTLRPEMRERFLRLLERMPPEQREQLLERLEERMRNAPPPADRPGTPGPQLRSRPAPGGPPDQVGPGREPQAAKRGGKGAERGQRKGQPSERPDGDPADGNPMRPK